MPHFLLELDLGHLCASSPPATSFTSRVLGRGSISARAAIPSQVQTRPWTRASCCPPSLFLFFTGKARNSLSNCSKSRDAGEVSSKVDVPRPCRGGPSPCRGVPCTWPYQPHGNYSSGELPDTGNADRWRLSRSSVPMVKYFGFIAFPFILFSRLSASLTHCRAASARNLCLLR